MAEEARQASVETQEGAKASADAEPSEAGSTESQDGEAVSFNLRGKYANPLDPDGEPITGVELRALVNQGRLARQFQADLDKTKAQLGKMTEEFESLRTAKEQAENALQERQSQERINKTLQEIGITGKKASDDWYDDDTPEINPEEIYRRIQETTEKLIQDAKETVQKTVMEQQNEYLNNLKKQQETERFIDDNLKSARKVSLENYQADMPDVDPAKIETVLDMETLAALKNEEAVNALKAQDTETFRTLYFEAEDLRSRALKQMTDLKLEQTQKAAEKQHEQEIETLSMGVVPEELQELQPASNPKQSASNREARLAAARKRIAARERAMNR